MSAATVTRLRSRFDRPGRSHTSPSVRLTEAGERLYASVRPALDEVRTALSAVTELSSEPRGMLRLLVGTGAEQFLRDEVLAGFLKANPHIRLDLSVSNEPTD